MRNEINISIWTQPPWTLKHKDSHTRRVCPALPEIKEKAAWSFHKSSWLGKPCVLHIHWCEPWCGVCNLYNKAQGGASVQRKRGRHTCLALSTMAAEIITGGNGFFDFCFQVSACQKGLQRAPPTAITASPCNVSGTEHSCFLRNRVVYYQSMFWDNGVQ